MSDVAKQRAIRRARGFTLIELMIVVVILGILATIAYPNYREYVRRGQRAEARSTLLEAAQFMARFYAANDRYDETRNGTEVALPETLRRSPANGTQSYAISLASVTATSYTLQAVPTGGMADDRCGTLTLTSTGQRGASGGAPVAECWK
ncbi:type IV pilin protein [Caldimonas thermodepolymerans]|jgi:type IV pilus assembly protein PilE|uniref:Type IV pilin n=1 Tax=Caldimonas thermodepolymerans TaxID=215580 RepID=A0A2S5T9B3_9BURK|nr:type IV pilin protein [Caldimonas thermodepolymerans]PPE71600.1 type IV pilin [Caldimonas thermodepolymerans]QPC30625.1 type IV pilin protein [Caldimonas thermodepolymerans]RDI02770.1 type IV pilus assembly protein PilE [Caldimonas thermodepolymerans]TCP08700.1 type IV pilus assembly protein PilE [Caldimonas thermodepolymerans]UZG47025.1 type IV pilin protein [Caldimonas thermodepolymerans]